MTAVERAAEVITDTMTDWLGYERRRCGRGATVLAQALADAGLLVTDEMQAVLDAVGVWFGDAVPTQEAAAALWATWSALLASRSA